MYIQYTLWYKKKNKQKYNKLEKVHVVMGYKCRTTNDDVDKW